MSIEVPQNLQYPQCKRKTREKLSRKLLGIVDDVRTKIMEVEGFYVPNLMKAGQY